MRLRSKIRDVTAEGQGLLAIVHRRAYLDVFSPTEGGLDEVLAAIAELRTQPHDFETVVLDSLDWLERLIWDRVCVEFNVKNIVKADGGYARGYTHAVTNRREVVDRCHPADTGGSPSQCSMVIVLMVAAANLRADDVGRRVQDPTTSADRAGLTPCVSGGFATG